ncbi:MAG: hypothetical protein ACLUL2_06235 [Blautia sp.]
MKIMIVERQVIRRNLPPLQKMGVDRIWEQRDRVDKFFIKRILFFWTEI